ncbi:hypothetical protein M409DRAFT_28022 [Zasmidium cellare ATCC 36951]|uniref:Uncharacterized protein n=1 Tax=Zasmidium cellare ATCC 36951 TaxID=1080233 RepID=A0A6A6C5U1_ZASCE|nr:uncharacterized protein M409DRAFT_28022 [Zasmidium cellare ATCC 36951]KAF2161628.1 hypothetical protein M409DRAFT_28022 [Zasmidium cellare ATCC 36951]
MPKAKELADRLRTILYTQLKVVGVTGSTTQDNQLFWHIASAGLTSCFMAALTVKGLLEAMPVEVEFKWISAGMPYVGTDMDRQPGSPSLNDPGTTATVARAVTPSLRYRDPEVNSSSGWIWVTKAKGILLRTTG